MRDLEQQKMKGPWWPAGGNAGLAILTVVSVCLVAPRVKGQTNEALPDAPSALLFSGSTETQAATTAEAREDDQGAGLATVADGSAPIKQTSQQTTQEQGAKQTEDEGKILPCPKHSRDREIPVIFLPSTDPSCEDQLQLIVDTGYVHPLTSPQKGVLAIRAVIDPFNLLTIAMFSGASVAANSHSVYGPGFKGWGKLAGYSLAEDSQADFTGIYVIPSLVHEDPRYHRMPKASVGRRIEHALIHTFVSQHDDGSLMPNYATIINVPLSAEISNLYVPDIGTNAPDTVKRVLVGYATDPIGPLVAEFLPDFAKRVHVHIIFAQQILNRLALGSGASSSSY